MNLTKMFNNSSTVSHLGFGNLDNAEDKYDLYTNNMSAYSIYADLNQIVNSNRVPDENLCELSKQKKHSYTRNELFKIRNERSDLIREQVPALIGQSWAYKSGQPWNFSDQSTDTSSLLSLKEFTETPEAASRKKTSQPAGQYLLGLIQNRPKSKESNAFLPNKKKSDPLQQFVLDHPDLMAECTMKRKIPSALTVQELESSLIFNTQSPISVQELESMQLNETLYEDTVLVSEYSTRMDSDSQSGQLNGQYEMTVDLAENRSKEKQHFGLLIEKLCVSQH